MERKLSTATLKLLEGKIIEVVKNDWEDRKSDILYNHQRTTHKVVELQEDSHSRGMYTYTAINCNDGKEEDIRLYTETIDALLVRRKEVEKRGGYTPGSEDTTSEYDPEINEKVTRLIALDEPTEPFHRLKGMHLCRTWRTFKPMELRKEDEEGYSALCYDIVKVNDINYDPVEATYVLNTYSYGKNREENLYFLSKEVEDIAIGGWQRTETQWRIRVELKDSYAYVKEKEYTCLLPESIPVDILKQGEKWLSALETKLWLRDMGTGIDPVALPVAPDVQPKDRRLTARGRICWGEVCFKERLEEVDIAREQVIY